MKKQILTLFLFFTILLTGTAQVAINTNGALSNPKAMLDISSDTLGLLIPRMSTASRNAFGTRALKNSSASYNVAMGTRAGYQNTSGEANTAIGPNALFYNVTGNNNTAVGNWAGPASGSSGLSNTTAIGNSTTVTADNTIHIGNSTIGEIAGHVGWSTYSDARFKRDIKSNVPGLDFILKLNPVTYHWNINKLDDFIGVINHSPDYNRSKQEQEKKEYTGFLAQEVEQAAVETGYNFSGVVHPKNEKSIYSIRYAEFVVPLVKAVQELSQQNKSLTSKLEEQDKEILQLKSEMESIKKMIINQR